MAHAKRGIGGISARGWEAFCVGLVLMLSAATLPASGPRYVTGPPFFTGPAGVPVGWRQANLLYYTDPGALSASVGHGAADALVAAAAGVWNVPVASITIAQGGVLAEHVSGGNVYLDATGLVLPDDVQSSNAAAVPIAVIYDRDGSVTDTLLGAGASDPSGCRQSSVTESVDSFDPAGVTPSPGRIVTFELTEGVFAFAGCQFATCGVQTDSNGIASIQGVPQVGGTISVQASSEQITETMSFSAKQRQYSMRLVSTPGNGIFQRDQNAGVFAVQIVGADGVSPASGQNVTFAVADQLARFGACADPVCVVVTDAQGMASTSVITRMPGTISLFATDNDLTQTANFTIAPNADEMRLISAPSPSIVAGSLASAAFTVEVLEEDGRTPAAGVPVLFAQIGRGAGRVAFGPCAAAVCTVVTDENGVATAAITGVTAGAVTLLAKADPASGGASLTSTMEVRADVYSLSAIEAETYVAEGATFSLRLDA